MGRTPSPIDPERMKQLRDEGLTFKEIAEVFGVSMSAVQRCWRKEGHPPQQRGRKHGTFRIDIDLERSDELIAGGMTMAEAAAALGVSEGSLYNRRREAGRPALKKGPRSPEHNGAWKGGRITDKSGYVLIHKPEHPSASSGGYVREHRLVMEEAIGRPLLPGEVVHHIDDDRSNNAIENLELFASNGEHLRATLVGKCPNWSEEGKAALRKARSMR